MKVIELKDGAVATVEQGVLYRMTIPHEAELSAPKEDPASGDVTFDTIAVDCKKDPNRKGFIFEWDKPEDVFVENFLKNPVMLYAHNRDYYPIGRWEGMNITSKALKLSGRIPGGPEYADLQPIRVRVRDGYMKAVSVGFYILRSEEVKDKAGNLQAIKIKSFELVECSPCPIGAHETAIISQAEGVADKMRARLALPTVRWESEMELGADGVAVVGQLYRLSLDAGEPVEQKVTQDSKKEPVVEADAPVVPELAGRVLSKKTRAAMTQAVSAMQSATSALEALLAEADKDKGDKDQADDSEDDPTPQPSGKADPAPIAAAASAPTAADLEALKEPLQSMFKQVVGSVLGTPEMLKLRQDISAGIAESVRAQNLARRKSYGR